MPEVNTGIWLGGFGSDIFGEPFTGRVYVRDDVNDYLAAKYVREYIAWQRANNGFHDDFEKDYRSVQFTRTCKYLFPAAGVVFGLTILNPNFTKRRSWYLRKIIPVFIGSIGYQLALKHESDAVLKTMLGMNDYLPYEVKRTLATKDYRYMVGFDYKNPDRQLFDPVTRKSLS